VISPAGDIVAQVPAGKVGIIAAEINHP